jgi:hypothetical protein
MSIFAVLMVSIFGSFRLGLTAFHKTTTKNELHQQLQLANLRIMEEAEKSALSSLSVDESGGIACFLSPLDNNGDFVIDERGRPEWQRYVVYYLNTTENVIYRREVPLAAGVSQRRVATQIEYYNPGTGREPLSFYATGGQPVARYIADFEPKILPAPVSQLQWDLSAERIRPGIDTPERSSTTTAAYLRN